MTCETPIYVMPDGTETLCACKVCGAPYIPLFPHGFRESPFAIERTCGKQECKLAAHGTIRCESCGKESVRRRLNQRTCGSPRCKESRRARLRGSPVGQAWNLGPPVYGEHLPGAVCTLSVDPRPRWPMEHRNVRALHGMITAALGTGHGLLDPDFALMPVRSRFGWAVYFWDYADAERLGGTDVPAQLFDQRVTLSFGVPWRRKAPKIDKPRGHRLLRIDAVTPVCSQSSGRSEIRTCPTTDHITSALTSNLPRRLRMLDWGAGRLALRLVSHETQPGTIFLGGKYSVVRGWIGSVVVDTNAVGEWMLRCCEVIGLGGRTSFGFGRVEVSSAG